MVAALAIGAVTMSFKMADTATLWHYTSNSTAAGAFADASNWAQGAGSSCGTSGTKPCQISVDAANQTELGEYLDGMDNNAVLAINPNSKRN